MKYVWQMRCAALALAAVCGTSIANAQATKKPTVGTLGTAQMAGGDARFGQTNTLANSGGYVYNVTITRAEYSVARHNIAPGNSLVPKTGEKLLILHLRVQNPMPGDMYFGSDSLSFSTIASDGLTRNHNDRMRLASAREPLAAKLKPGQKFPDEILAGCIVPAQGPVSKLIINMGRKGTKDDVTRYFLNTAPNLIGRLPAPDADTADPTGATARTVVPAKIGVSYPAGYFDCVLDSVAFVPGPIGTAKPDTGQRFLVATLTATNKTWDKVSLNGSLDASLVTDDDEKTDLRRDGMVFKGKRDEKYDGRPIDPDEALTLRLIFPVPNGTMGKTLKLAEIVDNSGGESRAFLYDVSGVK